MLHMNASRAYREAFPNAKPTTVRDAASELVRHPGIAPTIKRLQAEVARRYAPSKTNTLAEIAALAFSNVQDFYTAQGGLKRLADLPRHVTAAVKKVKAKEIKATSLETGEEVVIGHETELELHDKLGALKMVGQHAGLFAEDDATGAVRDFAQLLREARARMGKPALPAIEGEKVAK